MRPPAAGMLASAALALAGCATAAGPDDGAWRTLPGWSAEDHLEALRAVRAACEVRAPALRPACVRLEGAGPLSQASARAFLEANFRPEPVIGEGVLTAYFSPVYAARAAPEPPFTAPVRTGGEWAAGHAPDRAAIESRPPSDASAWLRPEDLYMLQVQGSGKLTMADGRRLKARYAGSNGRPYVALAGAMQAEGLIPPGQVSADAVHGWLAAHRGPEAEALMRRNPRYVFLAVTPDDGAAPSGSAGVQLPAGRAVAVDRGRHAMGELLWIAADRPVLYGARSSYARMVAALDTGSAISGESRADLYLGAGEAAGREAGLVRHRLRLWRLVPRAEAGS